MAIIERFRDRDLPTDPFTPQLLEEIGVPAGNIHRTLRALEFLGLLDPETGEPTATWKHLRIATDEEFHPAFEAVVRNAYAEVFKVVDPAKDTQTQIANVFRRYSPAAQRGRMVTLFLGLCAAAAIPTVDTPRKRGTKAPIAGTPRATSPTPKSKAPNPSPQPVATGARRAGGDITVVSAHPLIAGLLRTLPSDGGGWTPNERQRWLRAVESVIDLLFVVKVTAEDRATATESAVIAVVPE
jgi:hypothetical protein